MENYKNTNGNSENEAEEKESILEPSVVSKEQAEKYLANWQRTEADFINYKRRAEQERREISKNTITTLIFSLLPVLDDFDRALASIPDKRESEVWVEGIQLIARKLLSVLEAHGLTKMEVIGHFFDPNFHDAVTYTEGDEDKIIQELQSGYMLGDYVLRPAMVVVGKGKEEEKRNEDG